MHFDFVSIFSYRFTFFTFLEWRERLQLAMSTKNLFDCTVQELLECAFVCVPRANWSNVLHTGSSVEWNNIPQKISANKSHAKAFSTRVIKRQLRDAQQTQCTYKHQRSVCPTSIPINWPINLSALHWNQGLVTPNSNANANLIKTFFSSLSSGYRAEKAEQRKTNFIWFFLENCEKKKK